jgi:hypothetical protein
MPILTLEAIRENPWNVVTNTLPTNPAMFLLEIAYFAADYCRRSETKLMMAARKGIYTPPGWEAGNDSPDVHEENEARSWSADFRLLEICDLLEREFDVVFER